MSGYKRIGQIAIGLVILWGSYAIMYNINPELVNFKALKVKYIEPIPLQIISTAEYEAITGSAPLAKGAALQAAIKAGKAAGLDDDCYMATVLSMESGGNPGAIGHDENAAIPAPIGSRKKFLLSGLKKTGAKFSPPATDMEYEYKRHNQTKIYNDDDKTFNATASDYGLDWRFSHGIGLGQITIFPNEKTKCGGRPGKMFDGTCYTLGDLLTAEKNLLYSAKLFKQNLNSVESYGLRDINKIMAAFYAYNAGAGAVKKTTIPNISKMHYVQKAMQYYNGCKANPAQLRGEPLDPTEIIPKTDDEHFKTDACDPTIQSCSE